MVELHTERLRLRPLTLADVDWLAALHDNDDVAQFVGRYTPERATERLLADQVQWTERGHGLFAAEISGSAYAIGRFGLYWWEQFDETEIGWTLERPFWGFGYATEAARRILAWAFTDLSLVKVTAMIAPENVHSVAVARRLGFIPQRKEFLGRRNVQVHVLTSARFTADD